MLAGSLTEFGLADVFSLLAATRKTGVLHLEGERVSGRVWIAGGGLCYAVADVLRAPLAARLLHAGTAALDQVESLVAAQADGSVNRVTDALADLGLSTEIARALLLDQVADAVFDLTRWKTGDFSFDHGDGDGSIPVASAAEVLAIVDQRGADWDSLVDRVPGLDRTVTLVSRPLRDGPIQIAPSHWEVLTLVDGLRSVADIVAVSGLGQFVVTRTLAELHSDGLVRISADRADRTTAQHHAFVLGEMEERLLGAPTPVHPAGLPTSAPASDAIARPTPTAAIQEQPDSDGSRPAASESDSMDATSDGERHTAPAAHRHTADDDDENPAADDDENDQVDEYTDVAPDQPDTSDRSAGDGPDGEDDGTVGTSGDASSHMSIADLLPPEQPPVAQPRRDSEAERRARELSALGIAPDPAHEAPDTDQDKPAPPPGRDSKVDADLLARLIDGVKGA